MSGPHAETAALVTGGGQGLGRAIAEALVAEGCRQVTLAGRTASKLEDTAEGLRAAGAEVHCVTVDMADLGSVFAMVDAAAERMGRITSLVNCAANTGRGSILDTTPEVWDDIVNTNARGGFFALQSFARKAIAAGHGGTVVNILSVVVHGGLPFLAPYSASKAALANITKNSANALAPHRIRVNGINVGWMDTPGEDVIQKTWHDRSDGWLEGVEANMPFGQLIKPAEVAAMASLLLGPRSGVITGSLIDFDQQVVGIYPDTNKS